MVYRFILIISSLLSILISCSSDEDVLQTQKLSEQSEQTEVPSIDYSQLQNWRSELRVGILEARRNVNSSIDPSIKAEIFVNETMNFYVWIKNNLAEGYVDETWDDFGLDTNDGTFHTTRRTQPETTPDEESL